MAFKFVAFFACVAFANAGLLGAPAAVSYSSPVYASHQLPTVTSQHQNILRSPGNLAQVSTYSKTIDTPFSSVSKSDVRVSNPGYLSQTYAAAPVAHYAAPVAQYAAPIAQYATPVVAKTAYASPVAHYAAPVAQYAAPIAQYATPVVTKTAYAAPVAHYAAPVAQYAAPVAHYSTPVVAKTAIAAPAHGLLGVAYSAAPAVAHVEYHGNYLNYAF